MKSTKLLDIEHIVSIEKSVSEEISKSNLFNFFKTNIIQDDIVFDKDTVIFYTFIKRINRYNIFIIQNQTNQNISITPHIFSVKYITNKSEGVDLYITDKFFVLYCNGQLQCFKAIEGDKISSDDIENYISSHVDIQVDNIYTIDNNQFEAIKKEYVKSYSKVKKLNKLQQRSNSSKWLLLAIVSILLISYIYYFMKTSDIHKEEKCMRIETEKIVLPTITAVIDNSILINGMWYDVKQKYKEYTIESMNSDQIILIKDKKKYPIRISNE